MVIKAYGHIAQLVRAPRCHRGGHWFESSYVHLLKPALGAGFIVSAPMGLSVGLAMGLSVGLSWP